MSDDKFVKLCGAGDTRRVEEAIMNGANVNAFSAKYVYGMTALMSAAEKGKTETAELLIKYGADINAKDNLGRTALMSAALNGRTETAEMLINHGADVNAKIDREDSWLKGGTALMDAAAHGKTETAEMLINHGADINAKNNLGRTALTWATSNRYIKTATLLRRYGAEE